jgi:hypothetical protein
VAANATPLAGVLLLRWSIFPLMLLYWLENVVVGAFNVLRLLVADPKDPLRWAAKLFMIPFFCMHYGLFTFVHGMLLFFFFGGYRIREPFGLFSLLGPVIHRWRLGFALAAILLSHGLSFATNYIRGGEYQHVALQQLMSQPYSRVVVLHLALLGGAFPMMALHSPVYGLVLLIALKTGFDVWAHRAERRKLSQPTVPPRGTRPPGSERAG